MVVVTIGGGVDWASLGQVAAAFTTVYLAWLTRRALKQGADALGIERERAAEAARAQITAVRGAGHMLTWTFELRNHGAGRASNCRIRVRRREEAQERLYEVGSVLSYETFHVTFMHLAGSAPQAQAALPDPTTAPDHFGTFELTMRVEWLDESSRDAAWECSRVLLWSGNSEVALPWSAISAAFAAGEG